jgi:hypothetical protein
MVGAVAGAAVAWASSGDAKAASRNEAIGKRAEVVLFMNGFQGLLYRAGRTGLRAVLGREKDEGGGGGLS